MSDQRIDSSLRFSMDAYRALPDEQQIEDPGARLSSAPTLHKQEKEVYDVDPRLEEAINLAITLGRPLLLQGEPGCGKTRLASVLAYALKLPLEVSVVKSTSRAQDMLYTFDAVQRLYDAQIRSEDPPGTGGRPRALEVKDYVHLGPLGRAIARTAYGRRSVVLIDEIDKADLDFPNDLLWELDRLEFTVTEVTDMHYRVQQRPMWPILVVTHNEEKALPAAFLRRCIYHYIEFPREPEALQKILHLHSATDRVFNQRAIEVILRLRELDLSKQPGLSELLDWVGYAAAVRAKPEDLASLPYLGALLKEQTDQQRALATLKR